MPCHLKHVETATRPLHDTQCERSTSRLLRERYGEVLASRFVGVAVCKFPVSVLQILGILRQDGLAYMPMLKFPAMLACSKTDFTPPFAESNGLAAGYGDRVCINYCQIEANEQACFWE